MKQHKILTSNFKINQLWNTTMTNISINLLFYPKPLPELLTINLFLKLNTNLQQQYLCLSLKFET
jgi:hypothetical protein